MPANRVAALAGILTSTGALVAALAGVFPADQAVFVAVAALLTKAVTVVKFLDGAQKWESLQMRNARAAVQMPTATTGASLSRALADLMNSQIGVIGSQKRSTTLEPEEPGDHDDALPHVEPTDPDTIPPDEGDPGQPEA